MQTVSVWHLSCADRTICWPHVRRLSEFADFVMASEPGTSEKSISTDGKLHGRNSKFDDQALLMVPATKLVPCSLHKSQKLAQSSRNITGNRWTPPIFGMNIKFSLNRSSESNCQSSQSLVILYHFNIPPRRTATGCGTLGPTRILQHNSTAWID